MSGFWISVYLSNTPGSTSEDWISWGARWDGGGKSFYPPNDKIPAPRAASRKQEGAKYKYTH